MGEGTKEGTKAKAKFKKGQKVMVLYQDVNTGDPVYYAAEVLVSDLSSLATTYSPHSHSISSDRLSVPTKDLMHMASLHTIMRSISQDGAQNMMLGLKNLR